MSKIPDLATPGTLRPWWMLPIVTGQSTNAFLPLSHLGALPKGAILLSLADYTADTASTADADPGAGKVRWNNATQASATEVYIDDADSGANDHSALWASLNIGGYLYLYDPTDLDTWQQWTITSVTDATGYLKLGVTLVGSNGSFANGDTVRLTIQQPNPAAGVDRDIVTALATSGTVTVDCSLGDYFTLTPTAAVTGWTFSNVPTACCITILLTQGATGYAVAMPTATWTGGTAGAWSTGADDVDELSLMTVDAGGTWHAALAKDRS